MEAAANVRIIPANQQIMGMAAQQKLLNVAAYCRVSTDSDEQLNSYENQIDYYTNYISSNPEWTLAGIFADEGISGTQTKNRTEFNRMIRMCKKKKIDLILCKSTSRFARNTVDCLDHIRLLKSLGIGVIFEKENINTLTATDSVLSGTYGIEIQQIEQRRNDIEQARNDFVNLIATGACAPDSLDDEFARLYSEDEQLSQKLLSLKAQKESKHNELADDIIADIDNRSFELHQYDDVLVRKVVECVKILNKEEISVTFKGGYEIKSELLT